MRKPDKRKAKIDRRKRQREWKASLVWQGPLLPSFEELQKLTDAQLRQVAEIPVWELQECVKDILYLRRRWRVLTTSGLI